MSDTTSLRDMLREIHDEFGKLTPELIVEQAKTPGHPLHNRFDWDDTIAAHKWRLTQAAKLLRVTFKPDPEKPADLRAFVAVKGDSSHRSTYMPTEQAMADPFTSALVLRQMEREWKNFRKRYEHMAEFRALVLRDLHGEAS